MFLGSKALREQILCYFHNTLFGLTALISGISALGYKGSRKANHAVRPLIKGGEGALHGLAKPFT